jgi:hypothetical protein
MGKKDLTRDNHYVPIWYQKGFLPPRGNKLHYLNLAPDEIFLPNGQTKLHNALSEKHPRQCFYQTDLYSTFFGTQVNDEIERKLFGDIDRRGKPAAEAFAGDDASAWHRHFSGLFLYLDA